MAWVTGPHSDAPEGAICYPTEEHGIVAWFEPEVVEPPAREVAETETRQ